MLWVSTEPLQVSLRFVGGGGGVVLYVCFSKAGDWLSSRLCSSECWGLWNDPSTCSRLTDNGYLRLNHVRVPRANMLARFARVNDDGEYASRMRCCHAMCSGEAHVHVCAAQVRTPGSSIQRRYAVFV